MLPAPLQAAPPGFPEATAALDALDGALLGGLGRLNDVQRGSLRAMAEAFAGSPLAHRVEAAAEAACAGPAPEHAMIGLAAGREALQGARADALTAQLWGLLGHPAQATPATTTAAAPPEALGLLASARLWLVELALAGLAQVDPSAVSAFDATLGELQHSSPLVMRQATLLTGLHQELLAKLPLRSPADAPRTRWADLWSRGLLGCLPSAPRSVTTAVEGAPFAPFMIEAQHHRNMVSAVIWGVLDAGDGPQVARATLSGWRVDALAGDEAWWAVLRGHPQALRAAAEGRALQVRGALAATGDLSIEAAEVGAPIDAAEVAAQAMRAARWPTPAPTDRHPVQLAAPLLVEGPAQVVEGGLAVPFAGGLLPVSFDRISPLQGIDAAAVAKAARVWGLVRWDAGQWSLQPLAAQAKAGKPPAGPGVAIAAAKAASDTLGTLGERAAKLLRKKT